MIADLINKSARQSTDHLNLLKFPSELFLYYSERFLSLRHNSPKNHTQSSKKNDLGEPKMQEISALGPIDPSSVPEVNEEEKAAPWIMRKLVGVSSDFFNTK